MTKLFRNSAYAWRHGVGITLLLSVSFSALASQPHSCISPKEALQHVQKDVCVSAHVYGVVDAGEGVHFLDVCSPDTPDADCHFFILSLKQDADSVGDLNALNSKDIQIRGTVHAMQGRAEIVLSTQAQLHGGKERFHPNPALVRSFSAENHGDAFSPRNGTMGQHGVHFTHRGR